MCASSKVILSAKDQFGEGQLGKILQKVWKLRVKTEYLFVR